ncbi:MAG: tRNA (adenosine(37)-N6)-threonylcarbamoyltransferase complex dimerization subunit type 1 TsaB [Leptonema sp. (in: Bacteria)]|nr:tRNA (adenosine(37)-N6)-threonylcarbamoyltransferase complex dimerization subunit type 1 TsaB [Leptonema sp. (in: bacteria)]
MNCLIIDCSTQYLICGLYSFENGRIGNGSEIRSDAKRESSTRLVLEIKSLIEKTNLNVDIILCALGPGSFTGIRIGVATARNLSQLWKVPTIGIDTLTLYGHSLQNYYKIDSEFAIMIDGRKNRFYTKIITPKLLNTFQSNIFQSEIFDLDLVDYNSKIGLNRVFVDDQSNLLFSNLIKSDLIKIEQIPKEALTARSFLETAILLQLTNQVDQNWRKLIPIYVRDNPAKPKQR